MSSLSRSDVAKNPKLAFGLDNIAFHSFHAALQINRRARRTLEELYCVTQNNKT